MPNDEIAKKLTHDEKALAKECELGSLAAKIEKSRRNIADGKCYSEEEFDKIMDKLLPWRQGLSESL